MIDNFFVQHPPADLFLAARYQYKPPTPQGKALSYREAARANSQSLGSPTMAGAVSKVKTRTLEQMPAWVRSPEKLALIAKMKAAMEGKTDG